MTVTEIVGIWELKIPLLVTIGRWREGTRWGAANRRTREGTQEVWGGSGQPDFHENVWKSATERGRKVENTFCNGALNSLYAKPGLTLLG